MNVVSSEPLTADNSALPATPAPASPLETALARFMFVLSLIFLVVSAGVLHRVAGDLDSDLETLIILWSLGLLWPVFIAENLLRFAWSGRRGVSLPLRLRTLFFGCLIPPARLSFRGYNDRNRIWLPLIGWNPIDKKLRGRLERFFSVPMIVIALLILPFLALELYWKEHLPDHPGMKLFLDLGASIIWFAFAVEFILMVSVAPSRFRYCVQNWMDLAVVLLPLIEFLPLLRLLRLTRLMQVQQLSKMGRVYRLRGLFFKMWRAVLLLEMVQRIFGINPEKRLKRLKELLAAKNEEMEEIKKEIDELEKRLVAKSTIG